MERDVLRAEIVRGVLERGQEIPAEGICDEMTLGELGLDSADVLELIADLEDRHDMVVPLNELDTVRTFGQMVDHLLVRVRSAR